MNGSEQELRSLVRRIEAVEDEIADLNSDKADIYKEARSTGFNAKVLRKVVAYRRRREKNAAEAADEDATFDLYLEAIEGTGTPVATGARTRVDPATGEIIEDRTEAQYSAPPASAPQAADESGAPHSEPEVPTSRPGIASLGQPATAKTSAQEAHAGASGEAKDESHTSASPYDHAAAIRKYRPHCRNPENCASGGLHHCHSCTKALEAEAA